MPEEFSARKEATKIEHLAQLLEVPTYPIERADIQKKLQDEVNSLTPQQMRSVGLLIERETPRMEQLTGYYNDVIIDSSNNVTGFTFHRAHSDVSVKRTEP